MLRTGALSEGRRACGILVSTTDGDGTEGKALSAVSLSLLALIVNSGEGGSRERDREGSKSGARKGQRYRGRNGEGREGKGVLLSNFFRPQ